MLNSSNQKDVEFYDYEDLIVDMSPQEIEAVRQEAMGILDKKLNRADDIEQKVPKMIDSNRRDAKEVRRSIRQLINSQMGDAEQVVRSLEYTQSQLDQIINNFSHMNEVMSEIQASSSSYEEFRKLYFYRANVDQVVKSVEALEDLRHVNIGGMLEELRIKEAYEVLKNIESLRCDIENTGNTYEKEVELFLPYFQKLDVMTQVFVDKVEEIFGGTVLACIERALQEETEDKFPELIAIEDCVAICVQEIETPRLNLCEDAPLNREAVATYVRASVETYWEEQIFKDVHNLVTDVPEVLEAMRTVEGIFNSAEMTLLPLSTAFPLFTVVLGELHAKVVSILKKYADPMTGVECHFLVQAMQFGEWYKNFMGDYFSFLSNQEEELDRVLSAMLSTAVVGMRAHMSNLARSCAITVSKIAPSQDSKSGNIFTSGPVDLFVILQQSLATVTSHVEKNVMRELGISCVEAIETYMNHCRDRSSEDLWEDENEESSATMAEEEWREKRLVLICAFTNDLAAIENNVDSVESKFRGVWAAEQYFNDNASQGGDDEEEDMDGNPFGRVGEMIIDAQSFYVKEIVNHIMYVARNSWSELFLSAGWYGTQLGSSNPFIQAQETIQEFLEDLVQLLDGAMFKKVKRNIVEFCTLRYLGNLIKFLKDPLDVLPLPQQKHFSTPVFVTCLNRDIYAMSEFLQVASEDGGASKQTVELCVASIRVIYEILTATEPQSFGTIITQVVLDDFGDCPTFVVKFVLDSRTDIDKHRKAALLKVWNDKIEFQKRDTKDIPTIGWSQAPSYLSRLDKKLQQVEKGGFFTTKKGRKKKAAEQDAKEREEQKKERIEARKERIATATASVKRHVPIPSKKANVEVVSLQDLLGS